MEIKFQPVAPIAPLKKFIDKIWILESDRPMPQDDMKLVVPNGRLLLVIPFRNGIVGRMNGKQHHAHTNDITLIGMCENPSIVDASDSGPVGTIGVELNPIGAYRFFHLRMREIKDQVHNLGDLLGKTGREIAERIAATHDSMEKVQVLQQFLLSLFSKKEADPLFEYCIDHIMSRNGAVNIRTLERDTGYSSRWLNMKFDERLGISPKGLASILRFQHYYQAILAGSAAFLKQKDFYEHYYDESHFIKEFKRFTGMPPSRLLSTRNEFGRLFYSD